ncbi:MAG: hypothetical protein RR495_05735 [Anaerovoracaceae bacterium]
MKAKKTHRKYFIVLYIISYLMMMPPFIYIGDKASITLGLPTIITWLLFWSAVMVVGLMIQFKLDKKCEAAKEQS